MVRDQGLRRQHSSAGFSLIETIVAVALIGTLLSAISLGIATSIRATSSANDRQRAQTLLASYVDAIKQLDYVLCATPASYESAFAQQQAARPQEERLLTTGTSAQVVSVDGACSSSHSDQGTQLLELRVAVRDSTAVAEVVKRDPDAAPQQFTAAYDSTILNGGSASVGLVLKDATIPLAGSSIIAYEWTFPSAPTTVAGPDESEIVRIVPAVLGSATSITVGLKVTDSAGRTAATSHTITIPAALPSPTTTAAPTTTTSPTTTTVLTPPEGPAPAPKGFAKVSGGSGCCPTYGTFSWERVAFATEYLIVLDGYFLGGCVTDHSGVVPDPAWSPTPNGSVMTGSVADFGLCLGSSYNVTIQAKVNGVWGQAARIKVKL